MYDSIIIGSGPAGLTFATMAVDENEKILIIEKDNSIGGCHRVNRQTFENERYFCEHGPRVYFNNYLNFRTILKKMNLDFLINKNKKEYIEFAIKLALDLDFRLFLEQIIKQKNYLLFDDNESVNEWEKLMIEIYLK